MNEKDAVKVFAQPSGVIPSVQAKARYGARVRLGRATMNDSERAAQIEAVAGALNVVMNAYEEKGDWASADDLAAAALDALAPWSLDAMLDSVPGLRVSSFPNISGYDGIYRAGVYVKRDGEWATEYWGTGTTRMEALTDAVSKAKGAGDE